MTGDSPTRELARFLAETTVDELPTDVVQQAKMLILDAIGCGILGTGAEVYPAFSSVGRRYGQSDEATVWTTGTRGSSYAATLVNTSAVHLTELAEGVSRAGVHTSTATVPAAIAVAERAGASGADVVRSVALAGEAMIRFGMAMGRDARDDPAAQRRGDRMVALLQGWAVPTLTSAFGSATAGSLMQGADPDRLHQAWGIAVNMSPATIMHTFTEGVSAKGMLMAIGCANGLVAADLAQEGITGTSDIAGAWMPVLLPAHDATALTDGLGERYEYGYVLYKWFATIGPLFAPLEAMFGIIAEHGPIDHRRVRRIHVEGYRRTIEICGYGAPATSEDAKNNVQYAMAAAAVLGRRDAFVEYAFRREVYGSAEIGRLIPLVSTELVAEYEDLYPYHAAKSRVTVDFDDGSTVACEVDRDAIRRYHYPTWDEIAEKFRASTAGRLADQRADEVVALVADLEKQATVERLAEALA